MIVIFDLETDSLTPTVIWCLVAQDVATGKQYSFIRPDEDQRRFREFAKGVTCWIGQNVVRFDVPAIEKLIGPDVIPRDRVIDTLILSKLDNYERPNGHSLEAWGNFLNHNKYDFSDFSRFTFEMLGYCKNDVSLTALVYSYLFSRLSGREWRKAIRIEHATEFHLLDMQANGFRFNLPEAREIQEEVQAKLLELDSAISRAFPPKTIHTDVIEAKVTKAGEVFKSIQTRYGPGVSPESSFCPLEIEVFNAGSPKQIVERLHEAGWKPTEKTKGHIETEKLRPKTKEESAAKKERLKHFKKFGWSVNETNLATLPDDAPEGAKALVERMLHASRDRTLTEWINNVDLTDERIRGTVNGLGTWTQRASHRSPNTANIAAEKSLKYTSEKLSKLAMQYGRRLRSLWCATPGKLLVGTDAEGIQLRIFGHYLGDKGYIDAIVNGDKSKGTDIHSVNKRLIGALCKSRDNAKTFNLMDVLKFIELREQP